MFLQIVWSFPTVIFSLLMMMVVLYWLIAATGLIDLDILDGVFGIGADGADAAGGDGGGLSGATGPLMRLGLGGIPLTVVFTALVFFSWFLTYFAEYLVLRHLPGNWMHTVLGVATMAGALIASVFLSGIALRPLRRFFAQLKPLPARPLLGQLAIVRSPTVTASMGSASVEDGGAGLILQVRDDVPDRFKRGDRVVLIEYFAEQNAYRVIGEDEFNGP
ncbi:hypothetical protein [Lysobacter sp. cf310]|uniref:hypothetical protein n=1 Tax=Lysobacter sp. cf310 TaxID=1761790 RepID=UPI001C311D14|nr:hypothetical protein [Lysobacter sp. cf310]